MKASKNQIYKRRAVGALIAAIWLVQILQGCAEVPITERKGLRLVPETELLSMSFQQ